MTMAPSAIHSFSRPIRSGILPLPLPRGSIRASYRKTISWRSSHSPATAKVEPVATVENDSRWISTPQIPRPNHMAGLVGLTGGQVFHEGLRRHNVDKIFGYSGGAVLSLFDAIYNSPHVQLILPRHEQGAGHMAQGYSRATGKPGVVIVTSGPGSTNLVTPLQDALMDGTPLVVFCGQVPTSKIGSDAFQEVDMMSVASACTKWTVTARTVAELDRRIDEAFEVATSGRPGPVVVIIPQDVAASRLTMPMLKQKALITPVTLKRETKHTKNQLELDLSKSAKLINMAKKPIIFAGQGVLSSSKGPEALKQLSEKACIPVTTSLLGLGAFDEEDPKALHMLGLHGSGYANMAIQNADLVIALGVRFDDRVTGNIAKFAPAAMKAEAAGRGGIIHFDISPKNINKVISVAEAVVGNLSTTLPMLLPLIKPVTTREEWFRDISQWKKQYAWIVEKNMETCGSIQPQAVIALLSKLTGSIKEDTIITTGVGQHQMWTAQYFRWRHPRSLITSGGLGTMGFGLPSAIGAKIGRPEALVINVDGDASFCMSLNELATAWENNLAVKTIILNNNEQGMVTQLQDFYYKSRYSHTHQKNPDFVKVAGSMGVEAARVDRPQELEEKLRWLVETPHAALLEVMVDSKVPVLPTVPAGGGLHEFISA